MKTIIYYFSGSGNNLAVAKYLADELTNTVISPIRVLNENKTISSEYDWVGFTVPCYFLHIPSFVKECMQNLHFSELQRIFLIVCSGGNRGLTIQDMREQIAQSGKKTTLEYSIMMTGNYILSYERWPEWRSNLVWKMAKHKIRKIAKDIKSQKKHKQLGRSILYLKQLEPRLQESIASSSRIGQQYTISSECIHCNTCVNVCPVKNITEKNGVIQFGDCCNQCMACIQWCPQKAIDYNQIAYNRARYRHPEITASELNSTLDN